MIYIVISAKDRPTQLKNCLRSIHTSLDLSDIRISVLDASREKSAKNIAGSFNCDYKVVLSDNNQSKALNNYLMNRKWNYFLWLSDDNELVGNVFNRVLNRIKKDQNLGLVGLKVKDLTGPFCNRAYMGSVSSKGIMTCNQGLVKREAFFSVCGFSEHDFPFYLLDTDFTAKVLFAGYTVAISKEVGVLHYRFLDNSKSIKMKRAETYLKYQRMYMKKYANHPEWHSGRCFYPILFVISILSAKLLSKFYKKREPDFLRNFINFSKCRYVHPIEYLKNDKLLYLKQRISK